ncbi:MAG: bis(5'-nucleosyl)-tetraphosphatase (symmetrical) YqeK [Spirochaetales bacterium]|nr:bis(5'-nucleosyl)-tetraphosphatase (symmetrical) YqeK [Spirochaetales bacterium]
MNYTQNTDSGTGLHRTDYRNGPVVKAVLKLAESMLEPKRLLHCIGAAETAAEICSRYSLDQGAGYLAGLAHDLCKRMPQAEQLALARAFDGPLPDIVFENPKLSHGPAAAVLLAGKHLVDDPEILEAIAYHTVGKTGMGPIALAVYVADKIEPSRRDWAASVRDGLVIGTYDARDGESNLDGLRRLAAATVETLLDDITRSGRTVAATTFVLYNDLTGKSISRWPEQL